LIANVLSCQSTEEERATLGVTNDKMGWRKNIVQFPAGVQQCVTNIRIYSNIQIFLDEYIHSYRYSLDFKATNIFRHSFVELLEFLLSEYLNISGRIYSFVQIFVGC
jgi:hypothetical protein